MRLRDYIELCLLRYRDGFYEKERLKVCPDNKHITQEVLALNAILDEIKEHFYSALLA